MINKVSRYEVNSILFETEAEALKYESEVEDIKNTFSFYKIRDDSSCDFANGKYCYQRSEEFLFKLVDSLIVLTKKYHPFISDYFGSRMTRKNMVGRSALGRWLSDNNSLLYEWFNVQSFICPDCFREYGQLYFTINCKCDDSIKTINI